MCCWSVSEDLCSYLCSKPECGLYLVPFVPSRCPRFARTSPSDRLLVAPSRTSRSRNHTCCKSLKSDIEHVSYPNKGHIFDMKFTSISVRDEFRLGGLKSLARIFIFHCLHENQVVLPEYYLIFFYPKMAIWKIIGAVVPLSPMGRTPMFTSANVEAVTWWKQYLQR